VKIKLNPLSTRDGIHHMFIMTSSGFHYLCQQLAYLELSRILLIGIIIVELLGSYQEYPAMSLGKQGELSLIAVLVKS
jgi:hypothetical protein